VKENVNFGYMLKLERNFAEITVEEGVSGLGS
jgi:hypothetical protein